MEDELDCYHGFMKDFKKGNNNQRNGNSNKVQRNGNNN